MGIRIRRKKGSVRYSYRITEEHKTISRSVWHKRLVDAADRVTAQSNRPWSLETWTEMTRARLEFANIWYKHKMRYDRVTAEDFQAYIVMATI